jgi:hypothetical protein
MGSLSTVGLSFQNHNQFIQWDKNGCGQTFPRATFSFRQCSLAHSTMYIEMPKTYGTDRGMSSVENLELCLSAGIEKIAIQPKGRASALVNRQDLREFSNRRAGIEPRIGHLKNRGLGQSRMKTDSGDLISGYRSALSWNLSLLMRDQCIMAMSRVNQRSAQGLRC